MNDQPQRQTFFGACPHDCPDTCAMIYEVEDGKLIEVRGNREHPMTPRRALREAEGLSRPPRQPGSAQISLAPDWTEGLEAVRAHLLG